MTTDTLSLPVGLRVADLIAKTARVSLKDTLRVIAILDAVACHFDADIEEVVDSCTYDPSRPQPENITACEREFFALKEEAKTDKVIGSLVKRSNSLQ